MNETGNDLTSRHKWRRLTYEVTISTSATTIYSLPSALYEIVNNTFWSRTENEEAWGPTSEQEWQAQKGIESVNTLVPEWRLSYTQGTPVLEFMEEPGEQVYVLEYRSKDWIVDTSSSATSSLWTAETQRTTLDEHLFYNELKWRFLKAKGSDYSMDYQTSQVQLDTEIARDKGGSKILSLDGFRVSEGL